MSRDPLRVVPERVGGRERPNMTSDDALVPAVLWLAEFTDEDVMSNEEAADFFARLATYCLDTSADLRHRGPA